MTIFEWLLLRSARWLLPALALVWGLTLLGILAGSIRPDAVGGVYAALTVLAYLGLRRWINAVREQYIRVSPLPHTLRRALRAAYPQLSARHADLAERALRQFFIACLRSRGQYVATPSRAVEVMWEAFAHRKAPYTTWCRTALGHVPAPSPAQILGKKAHYNDGLRRAWYWACCDESIDPRHPSRLPLLFALDAKLQLPDGHPYTPQPAPLPAATPAAASPSGWHYGTSFADGGFSGNPGDFAGMEPQRLLQQWRASLDLQDAEGSNGNDGADDGGGADGGGGDGGGD